MPGPRDADLIVRTGSASDLTATETKSVTVTGGIYMTRPLCLKVLVPSQAGTTPTLKVAAKFTTDGKAIEVTHTENLDDAQTYPFTLVLPLPHTDDEALSVVFTVGGTSPDFGAVEAWLEGVELANVPAA
ncbi:hypothetical protein LCGC14_0364120 [marine sediment metagenome]|uniref:Uncharacterized protein n=1 Tax=marine sediment metagenome TaxID=412755 RepID=A0A0F9WFL2_9ZZZZ